MRLGNETGFHRVLCFIKSVEGLPTSLEKHVSTDKTEQSSWKTREDSVSPLLCMRTEIKSRLFLICAADRKEKGVALQVPCRTVIPKISNEELNNRKTPFEHDIVRCSSNEVCLSWNKHGWLSPLQSRTWDTVHVRSSYSERCQTVLWFDDSVITLDMIQMAC